MAAQQFLRMQQETPQACLVDLVPPVGGVISSLTNNPDGSLRAQWSAASDANLPVTYEVYVQKETATGLFSTVPFMTRGLSLDIYRDSFGAMLVQGETVFVAVRAADALGNVNSNSTTLSITAAGIGYANLLSALSSVPSAGQVADAVWDEPKADHNTSGTFGSGVNTIKSTTDQISFTSGNVNSIAQAVADKTGYELTSTERNNIATIVEAHLLNDGDGQALLNAIVAAIGNQNVDQIALIAAIRADIERAGGMLSTRLPTSSYVAPDNASIAAIKSQTDNLPADPASESLADTRHDAILAEISNLPSPAEIADAVWDEETAGHSTAGTFGENAQTPAINPSQVADAVWDAQTSDHNDVGSFGRNAQTPTIDADDVASAVWDAATADHDAAGSFGANAQNPPVDATQIAAAVWDESLGLHGDPGSAGRKLSELSNPPPEGIKATVSGSSVKAEVHSDVTIKAVLCDC